MLKSGLRENIVEITRVNSRIKTGISIYSFRLTEISFFSESAELAEMIRALIINNEAAIINAALFTRSTGFSKYIVIERGTKVISMIKNMNGKKE